jgi:HCOMODA/2-hydroxy-3-carboxy-muconic semialdehyde decarboxylase
MKNAFIVLAASLCVVQGAQAQPVSAGPADPKLIEDLIAANRILAMEGIVDAQGHVSVRHNRDPNRYLIALARAPELVTAEDLMEYDLDSNPVRDPGRRQYSERFIHGEIYKARPDVMSVVHSHSPSVVPFGLVGARMQAMFHNAAFLAAGVPVFDIHEKFGATDMLVGNGDKGVALAHVLGKNHVCLMRAHGIVACGPTLQSAVFRAVYTEVNARIQHWTMALGRGAPIAALDDEEGRLADAVNQTAATRAWDLWRSQVRSQVKW